MGLLNRIVRSKIKHVKCLTEHVPCSKRATFVCGGGRGHFPQKYLKILLNCAGFSSLALRTPIPPCSLEGDLLLVWQFLKHRGTLKDYCRSAHGTPGPVCPVASVQGEAVTFSGMTYVSTCITATNKGSKLLTSFTTCFIVFYVLHLINSLIPQQPS